MTALLATNCPCGKPSEEGRGAETTSRPGVLMELDVETMYNRTGLHNKAQSSRDLHKPWCT